MEQKLSAKIIADSISPTGDRVTTLEVVMHRYVLSEFNTHRVFSRNSASSRAIPFEKILKRVKENPAIPFEWGVNQPGMTPAPPLTGKDARKATRAWLRAAKKAARQAKKLNKLNVHKSYVNRLMEPFMYHTVIVTSTEWENFYKQRCHKDAQGEIRVPAEEIEAAIAASTPKLLAYGEWHTPFVQDDEQHLSWKEKIELSVARCARVSYLNHDGKRDIEADLKLYSRLASQSPPHLSPFEHVCTPAAPGEYILSNFEGWNQARGLIVAGKLDL